MQQVYFVVRLAIAVTKFELRESLTQCGFLCDLEYLLFLSLISCLCCVFKHICHRRCNRFELTEKLLLRLSSSAEEIGKRGKDEEYLT